MTNRLTKATAQTGRREPMRGSQNSLPIRLAHVLFVLWAVGSVVWALVAAKLAIDKEWWVQRPMMGAVLVLAPPILAYLLAIFVIRITGNPKLRN